MSAKEPDIVPLHADFDVVYRGFHRRQVVEHLENLEEQLRYTSLDREEALAQATDLRKLLEMTRHDLEEARARIERLEMSPNTTMGATERMHRMLVLAEDEAAEVRMRAERDVEAMRQQAEAELAEHRQAADREIAALRAEVEARGRELDEAAARRAAELDQREVDLERRRAEAEQALAAHTAQVEADCATAVAQAQEDADRLLRETAEQCNLLEAESEARRVRAQEELDAALNRQRAEVARHFAEQEELARARAGFVVKMACREAQRRIAEVQQRVDELRELRRTVSGELKAARAALAAAADRVPGLIPEQVVSDEQQRVGA